jgi:hypothetical protein
MKLKTRHPEEFRLCGECGALDPSRSAYAQGVPPGYLEKRRTLTEYLGINDQFLWCIDDSERFPNYEQQKPVEWLIEVTSERIVGYVNEKAWGEFLNNKPIEPREFVSKPGQGNLWATQPWVSVLVAYPLQPQEVLSVTLCTVEDANRASIPYKPKYLP